MSHRIINIKTEYCWCFQSPWIWCCITQGAAANISKDPQCHHLQSQTFQSNPEEGGNKTPSKHFRLLTQQRGPHHTRLEQSAHHSQLQQHFQAAKTVVWTTTALTYLYFPQHCLCQHPVPVWGRTWQFPSLSHQAETWEMSDLRQKHFAWIFVMTSICVQIGSLMIQSSLRFVGGGLVVMEETEGKEGTVSVRWAPADKLWRKWIQGKN